MGGQGVPRGRAGARRGWGRSGGGGGGRGRGGPWGGRAGGRAGRGAGAVRARPLTGLVKTERMSFCVLSLAFLVSSTRPLTQFSSFSLKAMMTT